jgi:hypothetical protein
MDLNGSRLLHESDLVLAVLRVAAAGAGTLDDCLEYLRRMRRYARVGEPMPEADVRARLDAIQAKLRLTGLIEVNAAGRSRITAFGRQVLAHHPSEVGDPVLTKLAQPRCDNAHRAVAAPPPQPASTEYQKGYQAYRAGAALADNPYPPDVRAHFDWESGWSRGRDDEFS